MDIMVAGSFDQAWSAVKRRPQGFGLELCQPALTRIPRQVSRARLELSVVGSRFCEITHMRSVI